MQHYIQFLNIAEKLKCEMRHSWLSTGRQESVAEHSWRMSLMVMTFYPCLSQKVNLEKCLKMAILHDLAEAEVGDIPVFETQTLEAKKSKFIAEKMAMEKICVLIEGPLGQEFFTLWEEYESKASYEAKFINALDKIEVFLQHVEAPLSTWTELEKDMLFQEKWLRSHCRFEPFLLELAEEIIGQGIQKIKDAGENISKIAERATALMA
ncbi:MAG: HD domain-containing protein [Alphaproteobacteria bacterium]|nr:HD domain-containing protein [Alphaproteobacteria bacterium]